MEKRNQHHNLGSACDHHSQTIQPQRKQAEIAPETNQQQQPPILQWPNTLQSATEQFMAVTMATQAPSPGPLNQWPPPPPFWHPQWHAGAVPFIGGPNVPTSSTTQTPFPNMCYPFGYPLPGSCDPSSWLGMMQQLQHAYTYCFPGALGFPSATPTMPGSSASGEQSSQGGGVRSTATLLEQHQKLWEAQSSENARLRGVISKLEAELSDYKDRLAKLEEVSSLKRKVKAPSTGVIGTTPLGTGQPRKRGRPRKSLAPVNALQESLPQALVIKPAPNKHPLEIKSPVFEKVMLTKVDNKEIANRPMATMVRQQTNEKILNAITDVRANNLIDQRKLLLSGETVYFETIEDMMNASTGLPRDITMNDRSISAGVTRYTNGNNGGASFIPCQKSARELLDAAHKGLFQGGSVVQQEQGSKVTTPGKNGANEEGSSEDLEDSNSGSGEDESEEEMGDDTSSSA